MPEEIATQPFIYKQVIDSIQPVMLNRQAVNAVESYQIPSQRSEVKVTFDQIKQAEQQSEKILRTRFPDLPPEQVQEVLSLFYGPFMMRGDSIHETEDINQKTTNAFAQKTIIHNIFYASTDNADEAYVNKIFDTAVFHDNLARSFKDSGVTSRETGMMAFLGIAKVIKAMGGKVYLPGDLTEVKAWDVENGIDACAILKNNVGSRVALLIDAKGQLQYPSNDPLRRRGIRIQADMGEQYIVDRKSLPDSLRSLKRLLREEDIQLALRQRIVIPTHATKLLSMKDAYQKASGNKHKTLQYYAQTSEEVEGRIAHGIYQSINFPVAV